jgi:subtilisin-like proprotein convertase family protein
MSAAIYNFFIEQGSDFQITFEYLDTNNNPINITNYCIRLRLKDNNNKIRVFSSDVICSNYSILKNTNGVIIFKLFADFTKSFDFDNAVYDLDITSTDGIENLRLATGRIEIIKNNFPECSSSLDPICGDCRNIGCAESEGVSQEIDPVSPIVTPTITSTIPNNPCSMSQEDLCGYLCQDIDMFGALYSGSGFTINDNTISSGIIEISKTGILTNIEVSIDKFKHSNPQDVSCLLFPPSGDPILLFSHNKINNYSSLSGLSFTFSNRAAPDIYLNNRSNSHFYLNILDKTNIYKFNNYNLLNSMNHMTGHDIPGQWTLILKDDDPIGSGSIDGWNVILTYEPPPYAE